MGCGRVDGINVKRIQYVIAVSRIILLLRQSATLQAYTSIRHHLSPPVHFSLSLLISAYAFISITLLAAPVRITRLKLFSLSLSLIFSTTYGLIDLINPYVHMSVFISATLVHCSIFLSAVQHCRPCYFFHQTVTLSIVSAFAHNIIIIYARSYINSKYEKIGFRFVRFLIQGRSKSVMFLHSSDRVRPRKIVPPNVFYRITYK